MTIKRYNYLLYDLIVSSEIMLPVAEAVAPSPRSDVDVNFSAISFDFQESLNQVGPFAWADSNNLILRIPGVARYWVSNGEKIIIDSEPDADSGSIVTFLLGSVFGALLMQRRHLVLHGNAIKVGDACVICVGDSGAGKSSLAACLAQRGYPVLADDVVPIDVQGKAIPGMPHIKIWQDVADQLGVDTRLLDIVRPDLGKFYLPLKVSVTQPVKVKSIYQLIAGDVDQIQLRSLNGIERFKMLADQVYRRRLLKGMGLSDSLMQKAVELAEQANVTEIIRPKNGIAINELADVILRDAADAATSM